MDIFLDQIKDFFVFIISNSSGEETNIIKKFLINSFSLLGLIIGIQFILNIFLFFLICFEQKHPLLELIILIVGICYLSKQYFYISCVEIYKCIVEYVQFKVNQNINNSLTNISQTAYTPT